MIRPETAARREAETSAAITAHAKKIAAAMPPLTADDVAVLREVFADVQPVSVDARQGRAS